MGLFRKNKVLKQQLNEKAEIQQLFMMQLLFEKAPTKPTTKAIGEALREKFGEVDVVSSNEAFTSFAIKNIQFLI
jgi:hypothetical protein